MSEETFNGWANYETWNVSLWINNEEAIYTSALHFLEKYQGETPYKDFISFAQLTGETPDGVAFASSKLDYIELNQMMKELTA